MHSVAGRAPDAAAAGAGRAPDAPGGTVLWAVVVPASSSAAGRVDGVWTVSRLQPADGAKLWQSPDAPSTWTAVPAVQGAERLVLDLRNNGGGLFPAGVEVGRMLIDRGDIVFIADR